MAVDGEYAGHIVISDAVKPDAARAIASLKRQGIRKTVMLTGDAKAVGESVAKQLGLDEVHAELLPADKVERVEELLKQKSANGKLAFVGDGINDAPVLSRADIGIAMGGLGSDAAIEAADVVLMDDQPSKIATAMRISKKTLRIVHQNIVFSLAVKGLMLLLGALGVTNMQAAIFADVGVMVLAVLNATRCAAHKGTGIEPDRQNRPGTGQLKGLCRSVLLSKPGIKIATAALDFFRAAVRLCSVSVFEIDFYAANGHTGNLLQGQWRSELVFANTLRTVPGAGRTIDGNGGA